MLTRVAIGRSASFEAVEREGERVNVFIRGAPFLVPLLYANMGLLGLLARLDPGEEHATRSHMAYVDA